MALLLARRPRDPEVGLASALLLWSAWIAAAGAAGACVAQEAARPQAEPHFDARTHTPEYFGPVDQPVDPRTLSEVRIGYFGPSDPAHPRYGNLWRAAQQAIEDANRDGGLAGIPFRLLPAWSEDPWGSGVKQITQLVYRDRVWAIIGGVDGPTTHLAEQVVVKARLALVSPVSTDKTVNLTNVPWMFSLAPNDARIADVLIAEIARRPGDRNLNLITTNDHDAFLLTRELRRAMTEREVRVRHQLEYDPQSRTIDLLVRQCLASQPDDLIIVANAADSLKLIRAVRQGGFAGCIFGGPDLGRAPFLREVGDAAGEIVFPRLDGEDPATGTSAEPPQPADAAAPQEGDPDDDFAARQTYDAVYIVTAAIRNAGLSRVEIARAIRQLSPIAGRSGPIAWDAPGSNTRLPTLATIQQGRIVPLPAPHHP